MTKGSNKQLNLFEIPLATVCLSERKRIMFTGLIFCLISSKLSKRFPTTKVVKIFSLDNFFFDLSLAKKCMEFGGQLLFLLLLLFGVLHVHWVQINRFALQVINVKVFSINFFSILRKARTRDFQLRIEKSYSCYDNPSVSNGLHGSKALFEY